VLAMLAAVVATAFYLRIILAMYTAPGPQGAASDAGGATALGAEGDTLVAVRSRLEVAPSLAVAIGVCTAFTVGFGIFPGPIIHLAERATLLF